MAVLVVIFIIVATGVGFLALGMSTTTTNSSNSYSSITSTSSSYSSTTSSSSTSIMLSTTNFVQDQTSSSFSCSNNTFETLSSVAGGNTTSSSSYNPIYLFGNFSSMSIRTSESANGSIAFADNSSYVVVGTPTINNTKFVKVNFTVSVNMGSLGVINETSTAWFAPNGNATEFTQGSTMYSGGLAAQEGDSLALSFTSLVAISDILASNLPSGSYTALNQTMLNFGQSQIRVTNYAVSQSYIQYVETHCPSENVSSLDLAWQSGVLGGTSMVTYFTFNSATSATSSFGITEQLVSFTMTN